MMADRAYLIFACMSGPSFNAHVLLRWGMPACPCMQNPELRLAERQETDGEACRLLRQRISALSPLLQETRELEVLTARYYDRSYHKHEKYTL